MKIDLSGASPGKHAVHLHEKGDCSEGGKGAGGHFNPDGKNHGSPSDAERHAGDFGNVTVGADGSGSATIVTNLLTISAGDQSCVGKAIIVHAKEDDFGQPTGNAGGRIGCGVVMLDK